MVPLLLEVERLEAPLIAAESNLGKIPDGFFNPDTIADKLTSERSFGRIFGVFQNRSQLTHSPQVLKESRNSALIYNLQPINWRVTNNF